jgi:hypothetical protein
VRGGALATLAAVAGLSMADTAAVIRPRRQSAPMRSAAQKKYRRAANARRAFALASKRRNRRRS